MAIITRQEIIEALERLGQLAEGRGTKIELALVGGALMVLVYEARELLAMWMRLASRRIKQAQCEI